MPQDETLLTDTLEKFTSHPAVYTQSFIKIISYTLEFLKTEFLVLSDREGSSSPLNAKKLIMVRKIICFSGNNKTLLKTGSSQNTGFFNAAAGF